MLDNFKERMEKLISDEIKKYEHQAPINISELPINEWKSEQLKEIDEHISGLKLSYLP